MIDHPQDPYDRERLDALIDQLTLDEKVQLLTGRGFWTTSPIEKIGLRRLLFSDGPSGVRGEVRDERDPSLNLPSATALAAAGDTRIARRCGAAALKEDGPGRVRVSELGSRRWVRTRA